MSENNNGQYINPPIRVAQMSDLHYSIKNLAEADATFGFAVNDAIAKGCQAFIVTGDSTDHAMDAHNPAFLSLARQIQRLSNHGPVLLLQGTVSHEPIGILQILSLVNGKHKITVASKIGLYGLTDDGFEPHQQNGQYKLVVTAFPTVNKADLFDNEQKSLADSQYGDVISSMLESFGTSNSYYRSKGVPTMLIGHGTVVNCVTEHGVPMAGMDHEFGVAALFSACTDVCALGHIHKHQTWVNSNKGYPQTIAYAGSIGRFHHGEEGEKFYLVWDMVANQSKFEAVVTPSRKTIDIIFEGAPDMDELAKKASACNGAFVRIRYMVDEEHKQHVNRNGIKELMLGAGALDVQIEGRILIVERQRAAGISTATTYEEKLKKWCEVTGVDFEKTSAALAELRSKTPELIASEFLKQIQSS